MSYWLGNHDRVPPAKPTEMRPVFTKSSNVLQDPLAGLPELAYTGINEGEAVAKPAFLPLCLKIGVRDAGRLDDKNRIWATRNHVAPLPTSYHFAHDVTCEV